MKKVFSVLLALVLMVSLFSVASAAETEGVCSWGFEHRAADKEFSSDGCAEVYFPTVRETTSYVLKLYKDGQDMLLCRTLPCDFRPYAYPR